jgi:hypothetical protein
LAAAAQAAVSGQPAKPVEPPKQKIDTGTLAAIGLVLTTLLGALGGIFGHILGLVWWQIPLAFLAILLAISAPSMLMAYLKLRRRNLGPILDANGWLGTEKPIKAQSSPAVPAAPATPAAKPAETAK